MPRDINHEACRMAQKRMRPLQADVRGVHSQHGARAALAEEGLHARRVRRCDCERRAPARARLLCCAVRDNGSRWQVFFPVPAGARRRRVQ